MTARNKKQKSQAPARKRKHRNGVKLRRKKAAKRAYQRLRRKREKQLQLMEDMGVPTEKYRKEWNMPRNNPRSWVDMSSWTAPIYKLSTRYGQGYTDWWGIYGSTSS